MIGFCVSVLIIIWIISVLLSIQVMSNKGVDPSFWAFVFVLSPILNTFVAIKYFRINLDDFKKFWKQLNGL